MYAYTVAFFGHRFVEHFFDAEDKVATIVNDLIRNKEYVEFLVGRDGDFDQIASSTVRRAKTAISDDNSSLVWVLPYQKAELEANEGSFRAYYDEVELCEQSAAAHPKAALQIRNRCMVDRADLVVCYVEHETGGAYQTMQYAIKAGKKVINLADKSNADAFINR